MYTRGIKQKRNISNFLTFSLKIMLLLSQPHKNEWVRLKATPFVCCGQKLSYNGCRRAAAFTVPTQVPNYTKTTKEKSNCQWMRRARFELYKI
jgi:hypothetical protein